MIGFGMRDRGAGAARACVHDARRAQPGEKKWFYRVALWTIPFPLIANSFGWIFTEMGRQPWVVFSQMLTSDGRLPAGRPGPRAAPRWSC